MKLCTGALVVWLAAAFTGTVPAVFTGGPGGQASSDCSDQSLGCVVRIRDIVARPKDLLQSYLRVTGRLIEQNGSWLLADESDSSLAISIDIPDQLVRRMFNQSATAGSSPKSDGALIRVSGAQIVIRSGRPPSVVISDFSFVQLLRDTDEANLSESIDGLSGTKCAKVHQLLGEYCVVGVSTVAMHRERYDGEKVSVRGYLRCATSVDDRDSLYASTDAASNEMKSEALFLGDDWKQDSRLIRSYCRSTDGSPLPVRVIGQFSAGDGVPERRDAIGLVHSIEIVWPMARNPIGPRK